jgi:hypothetical protein
VDFRSLQHMQASAIAFFAGSFPNSRRFRLQGLATLLTVSSRRNRAGSFTPAALLGFALRSFLLPSRYPVRFRPSGPTCRLFVRFTTPREAARPARTTAASGLRPVQESLASAALLARRPPAAPLGFSPFKAYERQDPPSVPGVLSRAFRSSAEPNSTAPQSIDSRRLVRSRAGHEARLGRTAFLGFLHLCDPGHSRIGFAGLCVHLAPCRTLPPCWRRSEAKPNPLLTLPWTV